MWNWNDCWYVLVTFALDCANWYWYQQEHPAGIITHAFWHQQVSSGHLTGQGGEV